MVSAYWLQMRFAMLALSVRSAEGDLAGYLNFEGNVPVKKQIFIVLCTSVLLFAGGCTQEMQNKLGRAVQNYTGAAGVLDFYAGDKLVKRFIKIDKITTATSTGGDLPRSYRYGYGVLDENQNYYQDKGEKKLYFEISDYSTNYIFYENPKN